MEFGASALSGGQAVQCEAVRGAAAAWHREARGELCVLFCRAAGGGMVLEKCVTPGGISHGHTSSHAAMMVWDSLLHAVQPQLDT